MIIRLVKYGGAMILLLFLNCGFKPPALDINPNLAKIYPGYKGGVARNGYNSSDESTRINPLWQIKFRYPLFYSPSLAGNYIFQPGIDKKIHVIDINTGVEFAEIKLRRSIGATPELADSFMAICEEGESSELLVINYVSGKLIWSAKTYKLSLPPLLYDNKIFWVDGKNRINAFQIDNGEKIWSNKLVSGFDSGPVINDSLLFISTRDNHLYCFDINNGKKVWKIISVGRTNSSPACFDDRLYICGADGNISCYNCSDGKLNWQHADQPRIFYSPVVDEEGVYYGSGNGRFVKLDRLNGKLIWDLEIDSPIRGTALLTSKMAIFTSLDFTVYMLDKNNGNIIQSYIVDGMVSAAPVVFDNKLFIATQDKILYCFNMTR